MNEETGTVTMRASVTVNYPFGQYRNRSVLVQRVHSTSLQDAKSETDLMRGLNPDLNIRSTYTVQL